MNGKKHLVIGDVQVVTAPEMLDEVIAGANAGLQRATTTQDDQCGHMVR